MNPQNTLVDLPLSVTTSYGQVGKNILGHKTIPILAIEEDAHEISYLLFDLEDGVVRHFGYWVLCVVVGKFC